MSTTTIPRLVPADYKTVFTAPCARFEGGQTWYKGTGVAPAVHPLHLPVEGCEACQSTEVLVIAAQYSSSPMNGDEYWDYEIECQACGKFTQRSYADN